MHRKLKPLDKRDFSTVLVRDLGVIDRDRMAVFICPTCGEEKTCSVSKARRGLYLRHQACSSTTHGQTNTRLFTTWSNMRARCYTTTQFAYPRYGGRGITICGEWKDSFESFRDWALDNGYEEHLTVDRIDNDGNYEPTNVRWVTMKVQANNRRLPERMVAIEKEVTNG